MNEELKEYFRELRMEIQQILQDDTGIPPRNMIEKMIFQLDEFIQQVRIDFNRKEREFLEHHQSDKEKEINYFEREMINIMDLRWEILDWLDNIENKKLPMDEYLLWLNRDTLFAFINKLKEAKLIHDRSSWDIIKEHFSPKIHDSTEAIEWQHSRELLAYMLWQLQENALLACRDLWQVTEPHFTIFGEKVSDLHRVENDVKKPPYPEGQETIDQIIHAVR